MSLPSVSESPVVAGVAPAADGRPPIAISVEDVSVTYRTSLEKKPTFKSTVVRLGRRERTVREIEAVKDVSLQVRRGSVVGILGANGAGKSTLVRTMAGILPPTSGRIEVQGRVSTLLALGVGFDKDLTGRQNVRLGGLASGLTREQLESKYEDIVKFAELEDFMDMPMRTYSSGMYGRLGFSVAVTMEPDILIIDEAMSVGDARFRKKSAARMKELCGGGRTIVLVSHALGTIQELCDTAVWMHKGELQRQGPPDDVIGAYTQFLEVGEDALTMEDM